MSLKAELETWASALKAYDEEDFDQSLELFSVRSPFLLASYPVSFHLTFQAIADSSKILTNIGLIYATLGEHEAAVEQFLAATRLDNYLAVASVPQSSSSPALLRIFSPSTIF
jgi:neutrophil cytosolic factor 2